VGVIARIEQCFSLFPSALGLANVHVCNVVVGRNASDRTHISSVHGVHEDQSIGLKRIEQRGVVHEMAFVSFVYLLTRKKLKKWLHC
jgi:hypothetical protein